MKAQMLFSCAKKLLNLIIHSLNIRKVGLKRIYPKIVTDYNQYILQTSCPSRKTLKRYSNKDWSMSSQILMNLAPPSVHSENKHELYWILNARESFCSFYFSFHIKKSSSEMVLQYFVGFCFSLLIVVRLPSTLVPKDGRF